MNILKAIGGNFSKLWRWIRETAWVQPLLIVGAIFAVIFSIPKFTTWFNAMGADSSSGYFTSFRLSLEGEGRLITENGKTTSVMTEADKVTKTLFLGSSATNAKDNYKTYADYQAAMKEKGVFDYGEKYYLAIVARDSSSSDTFRDAFQVLQDNWGGRFNAEDKKDFALKTIFSDEVSTNDDDYEVESDKKAFSRYLNKWNGGEGGADFFSYVGPELQEAPFKTNNSVSDSNYEHITMPEIATFDVPTVFLVDFSEEAWNAGRYGISEAIWTLSGSNNYDKANMLLNMWNHFNGATDNIFSSAYQKA